MSLAKSRRLAPVLAFGALVASASLSEAPGARAVIPPHPAARPISISPPAGTPDASPATQISLLGARPSQIRSVTVRGSRTGVHPGILRRYARGRGESFLPRRPFAAGERVSVTVLPRAGRPLRDAFSVGVPVDPHLQTLGGTPAELGSSQVQSFPSRPDLHPPAIAFPTLDPAATASGDALFLAPFHGQAPGVEHGQSGPLILDARGRVLWSHPLPAGQLAFSFRPQTMDGRPVLTWWQGVLYAAGYGAGEGEVLDASYRPVARVRAGNGLQTDLHGFVLAPGGVAYLIAYQPVGADLRREGGPADGVLLDNVVQEIDLRSGLVMWEWHALGHLPLGDSRQPYVPGTGPWDPFHLNWLQSLPGARLLLSARNTWAAYAVAVPSGHVAWSVGGRHGSFALPRGAAFAWQHDVELHGDLLSLFDDEDLPPEALQSRGLVLRLDFVRRRAALARALDHPAPSLLAANQGSVQLLPRGGALVGWGAQPWFTEFSASGAVILDAQLPRPDVSYQVFAAPWTGRPAERPALGVDAAGAHASWNGATLVSSWQLLAGPAPGALSPQPPVPRSGFDTPLAVPPGARALAVRALSAHGRTLGTSAVVATG